MPAARRFKRVEWSLMFYWLLVFLVIATIGFALVLGISGTYAGLAQIVVAILLAFVLISIVSGLVKRVR